MFFVFFYVFDFLPFSNTVSGHLQRSVQLTSVSWFTSNILFTSKQLPASSHEPYLWVSNVQLIDIVKVLVIKQNHKLTLVLAIEHSFNHVQTVALCLIKPIHQRRASVGVHDDVQVDMCWSWRLIFKNVSSERCCEKTGSDFGTCKHEFQYITN